MKTTICIALFAAFCSFTLSAQDIEGLEFCATKKQVIAKFGQPVQYEKTVIDDGPFLGIGKDTAIREDFNFDGLSLEIIDNRIITCKITTSTIRVMTNYVNGGLRVGDTLEHLVDAINSFKTDKMYISISEDNIMVFPKYDVYPITFYILNGKVQWILINCQG